MNVLLSFIVLAVFSTISFAKESPPKIKVYSQNPVVFGKENILVCHLLGFYPQDIHVNLLENGEEIPGAVQSELGINSVGMFHLSKNASITPERKSQFACHVRHMQNEKTVIWEPVV
ncbi:beta-2-microglobulin-like [Clarias gariepinus]|uniref:beta-2-microglobulin-like n=1 Tax=Clarias gariepinus TaxID=13013 RepID=UPI00234DAE62|nr:beta-2-microglobulin-like [Clarias gariepinus]